MNPYQISMACSECGKPMDYEYVSILPGSSEPGYMVDPCCDTEGTTDTLEYIKNTIADELRDANDRLQDAFTEYSLALDSVGDAEYIEKCKQDVADRQSSLTSYIDELHAQFKVRA